MRSLVALLLLLMASPALARTLAVLPLEPAAGSDAHEGLGIALSGMLTSDLSHAADLTLVERARLDVLLEEIELGDSGFLDPDTARELGKGVGAEWVLVGSWSVVGPTFLLDARVVEVQSGEVVEATAAQGEVTDFVTVEKVLVEALLAGLSVDLAAGARRRLLGQAPTESFEAFAAYGEGEASMAAGCIGEAQAAFSKALTLDPQFHEAREAVAALQARVQEERARRVAQSSEREAMLRQRVLDTVPDPRARPKRFDWDMEALAYLGVRWKVLEELGLDCQLHDEMRWWLDRSRWETRWPEPAHGASLHVNTMAAALELELIEPEANLHSMPTKRSSLTLYPVLFAGVERFLLGLDQGGPGEGKSHALTGAIQRCYPRDQVPEHIWELVEQVRRRGLADRSVDKHNPDITLEDHLLTLWALLRTRERGLDAVTEAVLQDVVDRHPEGGANLWAVHRMSSVAREGELFETRQVLSGGLPVGVLEPVVRDVASGGGESLVTEGVYCPVLVERSQRAAENALRSLERDRAQSAPSSIRWSEARLGPVALPLMDMGCVRGHPARASDVYAVFALVGAATEHRRVHRSEAEECVEAFAALPDKVRAEDLDGSWVTDEYRASRAFATLHWYYSALVRSRCVEAY